MGVCIQLFVYCAQIKTVIANFLHVYMLFYFIFCVIVASVVSTGADPRGG